jgi:acetoin utilization protein AcuC
MAKAAFIWSPKFTGYDLGPYHPLKPKRLDLTHHLLDAYGLLSHPEVEMLSPQPASREDLLTVHSPDFVDTVIALEEGETPPDIYTYGLGTGDNPIFPGIYQASALYSGASLLAAEKVFAGEAEAAFNIAGGLHHAHHNRAAGFCVFNDPALAIKRLLQLSQGEARVVYLDIDAHHGDGVQEAFWNNPKVLTISLHETGQSLFPGSGFVEEIGEGEGKGFAVNLPLAPATEDATYLWAFEEIVPPLVEAFRPDFLCTQLGVDAHYLDPLTHLSLTTAAYEKLFAEMKTMAQGRWIAFGGGGYSLEVVPRVWTLAVAAMLGENLSDTAPGIKAPLRDQSGPALTSNEIHRAREYAQRSVEHIKKLIFPYHGL